LSEDEKDIIMNEQMQEYMMAVMDHFNKQKLLGDGKMH